MCASMAWFFMPEISDLIPVGTKIFILMSPFRKVINITLTYIKKLKTHV